MTGVQTCALPIYARRIVRHGNPEQRVQDLLPQVVGRSVLRIDLVVERKASKELLDRHQEVSFVVVILKLREDEAMAKPRECTQEDCCRARARRQPDGSAVRPALRLGGDMCHPAAQLLGLIRVSALCRNGNTRPKTH